MLRPRNAVLAALAAAMLLSHLPASAQPAPAPAPQTEPTPGPPATPPATPPAAPETPPAAQPPAPPPAAPPGQAQAPDPFGEEVTLTAKTILFFQGTTTLEAAFDNVVEGLKSVGAVRDRESIKAAGPALVIYSEIDNDNLSVQFKTGVPIGEMPKNPPKGDIAVGETPTGKALKFVHRGSYDSILDTYDRINDYMGTRDVEATGTLIEEFVTDPLTTPEDQLVINIFVLFSDPGSK